MVVHVESSSSGKERKLGVRRDGYWESESKRAIVMPATLCTSLPTMMMTSPASTTKPRVLLTVSLGPSLSVLALMVM